MNKYLLRKSETRVRTTKLVCCIIYIMKIKDELTLMKKGRYWFHSSNSIVAERADSWNEKHTRMYVWKIQFMAEEINKYTSSG
jgi:hypothetical protein